MGCLGLLSTGPEFFANWFAGFGKNEVSRQWRHPQRQPPDASYSCTFCHPTGYQPHGVIGHRPAYGAFLDRVEVDAEVKTRELMAGMTEEELRALAQLDGEW